MRNWHFLAFFSLFRTAPGKSRKRRKKAFLRGYPRICLNPQPHLLNPHFQDPKWFLGLLVRLRFGGGTARAVPVFGSGCSFFGQGFFCLSAQFNRKGRFQLRFQFLENCSGDSGSARFLQKRYGRFRFGSLTTLSFL